ncbi:MAG: hypothetical protein A2096_05885 [Spirochaetes bacterium GWF1_41_5]|nr:MAG: hypothetical protein A2096_05885 [Spirochaetes bacterium GWF1_41_5]HBE01703.1 hypothetical protein [Spirochaetia bacterium]
MLLSCRICKKNRISRTWVKSDFSEDTRRLQIFCPECLAKMISGKRSFFPDMRERILTAGRFF